MRKNYLVGLSIFFSLCLITFACRKDIDYFIHGREKASSMLLESAKMWHLQHLTVRDPNSKLIPLWNDAWILKTSKGTRVVAPAPERQINNRNINIRRFVVFNVSGNNITDGRIVEFLGEKYNVSGNIDLLLEKYPSGDIPDFTGAVMQYDVNYYPISSTSYKNGTKDKRTAMVLNYDRKSLQKKTKDDLRMVVLSRYPATNLGKKNASVSYCSEPDVEYNGVPAGLADDCSVTFYVITYRDTDGCAWLISWNYMSHTCPGGSGNGSATAGSGGGSGSGSGGWNNGGPPYGGGGSEGNTASALAEFNRKIDAAKLLDCMKSVLNRIQGLSGNTVANIINDFSGDIPGYNWELSMRRDSIGVFGLTSPEYNASTGTVTTFMNSNEDVIRNASDLAIAKTLIHESVHAYLTVELSRDFDTAKKTYPELIGFWGIKKNQNAAQHELFVKDFADDIAKTLKLYGESRGYNLPDQFYSDMSWGALTETEAFKKLSVEDQTRIRNVTKAEQFKIESNGITQKGTDASC